MREDSKLCRLCAKSIKNLSAVSLFERSRKSLIRRIFQLTGVKLKNISNIPTAMCSDCETELSRAYEFREHCISAQKYFSSAKYKTHVGQSKKESKSNSKIDFESALVKEEVMLCAPEDVKTELEKSLEDIPNTVAHADCEFLALNEDEIAHASYDEQELEPLDQKIEDTTYKPAQRHTTVESIEEELETTIGDSEKPVKSTSTRLRKVRKCESDKNDKKKAYLPEKKPKGKGKSKERIYVCDQCGNQFKYRSHFYSHIKRHTGVKSVQCEVCPDKFFTDGELKRHMRRHTGERPFACQHCQRRFTDYSTRVKHERTHTNERPFGCPQCGKAFTTSYVLKNHMLVHTGERSFKCTLCDKSFPRQTNLIVHTRSLSHKQLVEREQQKLIQQNSGEIR
ncbi:transcription factor Ouib-like isoform X1 [Rhagoletis pomonella]|uniref:transcription factor Ouib-like isoform X1 n=1 Tax=Rhagoletis pomonella TaxID=28610 RepID=UPI0017875BC1|nr:transcription factor Ouib-like isoform X1 [Rhagoletis pomonella]XP_036326698.1 transcription factor Ouib-like isoform X1 [Rhagoletis pomonella]XP_036326706.1 transcription factor Ouib-like isoform X1 [Rhagoletis pomonella]